MTDEQRERRLADLLRAAEKLANYLDHKVRQTDFHREGTAAMIVDAFNRLLDDARREGVVPP